MVLFKDADELSENIAKVRYGVKSFVIYQLANRLPPSGSGVGCGYYDPQGAADGHGISRLMNDYVFDVCFNPEIALKNVGHFIDHCLTHLTSGFFSGESGYTATEAEMPGGLDPIWMGRYWSMHREQIVDYAKVMQARVVFSGNYTATYRDHLPKVYEVLDKLAVLANQSDNANIN